MTTQMDPRSAGLVAKDVADWAAGASSPSTTDWRSILTVTWPTIPSSSARSTLSTGMPFDLHNDSIWPVRPPPAQMTADDARIAS